MLNAASSKELTNIQKVVSLFNETCNQEKSADLKDKAAYETGKLKAMFSFCFMRELYNSLSEAEKLQVFKSPLVYRRWKNEKGGGYTLTTKKFNRVSFEKELKENWLEIDWMSTFEIVRSKESSVIGEEYRQELLRKGLISKKAYQKARHDI